MYNASMKDLLITLVYFEVCKHRHACSDQVMSLENFKHMIELEEFTDAELTDVEYISQRMSVWIDNSPLLAC